MGCVVVCCIKWDVCCTKCCVMVHHVREELYILLCNVRNGVVYCFVIYEMDCMWLCNVQNGLFDIRNGLYIDWYMIRNGLNVVVWCTKWVAWCCVVVVCCCVMYEMGCMWLYDVRNDVVYCFMIYENGLYVVV